MVLDGDAAILPPAMADELIAEVGHCDARWHTRLMRHDGDARAAEGSANVLPTVPAAFHHGAGC
jgi:hypothetical protein